ncbi:cold-shock protein [Frateuria soli]|uniref:cold-shock protein n=1 Tax=Frateuria soli TaxID=1542730 RepID=UPI001E572554|nr:cold shock domain-containing protein [Frateuria soli]UGB39127.1 cold shock domain-containing protein [Frateuria soli]
MNERMEEGTVTHWLDGRGYGFIRPDLGGDDVFVNVRQVEGESYLREGDRVRFESRPTERGLRAFQVRRIVEEAA